MSYCMIWTVLLFTPGLTFRVCKVTIMHFHRWQLICLMQEKFVFGFVSCIWNRNWIINANVYLNCIHRWYILLYQSYIHTHIHTYNTHTHIHTYIYTHIHTYIHTYIHTHIHTYIYTYTHTYIHTYLHAHIHTYNTRAHAHTKFLPCKLL